MVSRRLERELWEKFQRYCEYHVPRVSDTEIVEKALREFLNRHKSRQDRAGE